MNVPMSHAAEMPPGFRLVSFEQVGSTNTEAMRLAGTGDLGRVWIVADEQTAGRGRSGRSWTPVAGNLYASLLLRLTCGPDVAQQLALVAGVAVVDAVRTVASGKVSDLGSDTASVRLKWPNDILIGGAKLGGILLESAQGLGGPGLVTVIGVGLNIAGSPQGLGRDATSLAEAGIATDRAAVLSALAMTMDAALAIWDEGSNFQAIRAAWSDRAGSIGEPLVVNAGQLPVSGCFAGLDNDGALLLTDEQGSVRRFTYGDVTLAGRASAQ